MSTETVTTTNGEKPMLDNTEETTKHILTSIAQALAGIEASLDMLNDNISSLNERFEKVTGTFSDGERGFVRVSHVD
jgi:hypothetical protein